MMKLKAFMMVFLLGFIVAAAHLDIQDQISSFRAMGEDIITAGLSSSGMSPETAERVSTISFKVGFYAAFIPWQLGQYSGQYARQYASTQFNLDNPLESKFASLK